MYSGLRRASRRSPMPLSVPANEDEHHPGAPGIECAVDCSIPMSGAITVAGRADGEVCRGSKGREVRLPPSCFFDPCMVNCQEIGTLNESSENEPGIAGLGGAYRQGSDGDGAISKGR